MLTSALSNEIVFNRFRESEDRDEVIKFILTGGKPKETKHCSECREILSAENFAYYQARVSRTGFLSRSNALCDKCSKKINKERREIFKDKKIPPKPKAGTRCPNCPRGWSGNWHRPHDYVTHEFYDWCVVIAIWRSKIEERQKISVEKNKIICGNAVEKLKGFDDSSIDLTVFSPPYDGLRNYNGYDFNMRNLGYCLYRVMKEGGVVAVVMQDQTTKGKKR